MSVHFSEELAARGFAVVPNVMEHNDLSVYKDAIDATMATYESPGQSPGLRNVFETIPASRDFVLSSAVRRLVAPILGENYFAVRALVFDKNSSSTVGANWKVPFHQDLTIAVWEKAEVPGFSAWSIKARVPHVQPPIEILEKMLTVRLHLDDCDADNGALRVLPGSHQSGRLSASDIQQQRQTQNEETCVVPAGGVLLMRPLLLHASSAARTPRRRRVLHLEFSSEELPHGLKWHWRH